MIWNLIGTIGGKVLDIVDNVVEDKDEANRLKFEIQRQYGDGLFKPLCGPTKGRCVSDLQVRALVVTVFRAVSGIFKTSFG